MTAHGGAPVHRAGAAVAGGGPSWHRVPTAIHEAGHVVLAWLRSEPVAGVSITPDAHSLGRMWHRPGDRAAWYGVAPAERGTDLHDVHRRQIRVAQELTAAHPTEARTVIGQLVDGLLAGLAAEACLFRSRAIPAELEVGQALALLSCVSREPEYEVLIHWMAVRGLFDEPPLWRGVQAVARDLLKYSDLDGPSAVAAVELAITGT